MIELEKYNDIDPLMIKSINRKVFDIITIANLDLQQVSYLLSFDLKGYIHLFSIHLIWKYFEQKKLEILNKNLQDVDKKKEMQRNFFYTSISNDYDKKTEKEIEKLKKSIEDSYKFEKNRSIDLFSKNHINNLKKIYTRKRILQDTDEKFFNSNNFILGQEQKILDYLLNPQKYIIETYDEIFKSFFLNEIDQSMRDKIKVLEQELDELNKFFIKLEKHLINVQSLDQNNSLYKNCFDCEMKGADKMEGDDVLMIKYEDELAKIFFQYFLNCILGINAKTSYKTNDNKVIAKINSKFIIEKHHLESSKIKIFFAVFESLSLNDLKIYNLLKFISCFIGIIPNLKKSLNIFESIDKKDLEKHKSSLVGCICNSKCPCCDRMCGEDDTAHIVHKCIYGHQIRAFGGVKLSNNDASVIFCEDLADNNIVELNGLKKTWAQFKEDMKKVNSWDLAQDFLSEDSYSNENIIRIKAVWKFIGKKLCENYKMNYIEYNEINLEKQTYSDEEIHYCFVIDSSGSI